MRDHAADRLLRPRSRDREDGKNRERLLRHCAAFKELPAVALVFNAGGNGLRRVDHGTAAHGNDRADPLIAHPVNRVAHEAHAGVGLHAALFDHAETRVLEALFDRVEDPRAASGTAAEKHKDLGFPAENGKRLSAYLKFSIAAENEARGIGVGEVQHIGLPSL